MKTKNKKTARKTPNVQPPASGPMMFRIVKNRPIPIQPGKTRPGAIGLATTAELTGWSVPSLEQLHRIACPPPVRSPQRDYRAELADWMPAEVSPEIGRNTFQIRAWNASISKYGPVIATISVNNEFTQENAAAIANLMSFAPSLWQALQDIAPCCLTRHGPNEEFRNTLDTLWQSADRFPFEWPNPDASEEDLMKANTIEITAQMAAATKGGK